MDKRLKILLVVLGMTIAGVAGFMAFNPNSPALYRFAHPTNYEECKRDGGTLNSENINSCIFKTTLFYEHKNKSESSKPVSETAGWKRYANEQIASFNYPENQLTLTTEKRQLAFFDSNKISDTIVLSHQVDKEHCGLSGLPEHCTPKTTDFELTFTTLDLPLSEIIKSKSREIENVRVGQYYAMVLSQGAEGEGTSYDFVAMDDKRTVEISHHYIDESVMVGYKDVPGFITIQKGGELIQNIFSTLLIGDSSSSLGYENKQYGFGLSYQAQYGPVVTQNHTMGKADNDGKCVAKGTSVGGNFPYEPIYNFSGVSNDYLNCQKVKNSIYDGIKFETKDNLLLVYYPNTPQPVTFQILKREKTSDGNAAFIFADPEFGPGPPLIYAVIPQPVPKLRYMLFNSSSDSTPEGQNKLIENLSQLINSFYVLPR